VLFRIGTCQAAQFKALINIHLTNRIDMITCRRQSPAGRPLALSRLTVLSKHLLLCFHAFTRSRIRPRTQLPSFQLLLHSLAHKTLVWQTLGSILSFQPPRHEPSLGPRSFRTHTYKNVRCNSFRSHIYEKTGEGSLPTPTEASHFGTGTQGFFALHIVTRHKSPVTEQGLRITQDESSKPYECPDLGIANPLQLE
jgi:hypothetical protein